MLGLRSPLNIVHAGLDIVRSEIEASSGGGPVVFISPETAKMIRNMFSASETAIQILNDLLHYEHIDAGEDTIHTCIIVYLHYETIVHAAWYILTPSGFHTRDVQVGAGCPPADALPGQGHGLGQDAGGGQEHRHHRGRQHRDEQSWRARGRIK